MADFTIRDIEGMRQVQIEIRDETVRARKGAMSNMRGKIKLTPRLPGGGDVIRALFVREPAIRPYYTGTGSILLQPSHGGYHVLDVVEGDQWILEPGVFWACEGDVRLGMKKERFWPSFWSGDGFFPWKTVLTGQGRAVINAPGPVETVDLEDETLNVQGRLILGRTSGLRFTARRPSTFFRSMISGQQLLRSYSGKGKALVCWTPYWNERLLKSLESLDDDGSMFV
ncbi:MAG: AIM24 family protein [Rhodobacterales bacterium]|jgi:hypothetical protein|nr:AIM24 family protein [Rhodobacterales bacterium]